MNMDSTPVWVILVAIFGAVVVLPLSIIWTLNTLFGLDINYGFFECLAALLFYQYFGTSRQFISNAFKNDDGILNKANRERMK